MFLALSLVHSAIRSIRRRNKSTRNLIPKKSSPLVALPILVSSSLLLSRTSASLEPMGPKSKPLSSTYDLPEENPFARSKSKAPPARKQNIVRSGNAGNSSKVMAEVPGVTAVVAPTFLFRKF